MKINQKGMTLAEVLVSLLMVSIVIFAAIAFMTTAYRSTRRNQEKEFAVQKAMSILDELKSFVENNAAGGLVLDTFDESGSAPSNPLLTIVSDIDGDGTPDLNPDDPTSGNTDMAGRWLYLRQITVAPIGSDENRLVNVKLFITDENGGVRLISEVAGVLRTIAPAYSPTQVHDVYLLAIDNVPGWWVYMSNIIPFVQSTLQDLSVRNPGLEFRTHWITKLSYGRNSQYTPYFNKAAASTADINYVYFYPGLMPPGSPVSFYYQPDKIPARINVDGAIQNDYNDPNNLNPYAIADNYNNAMRYPDEKALFDLRVAEGKEKLEEPTYRLLLEDMFQNPTKYRNAIFINLHGEMFPFPPIRNYSDPAKDPENGAYTTTTGFPRVVTHPQKLRYTNAEDLKLRVYSFIDQPSLPLGTSLQRLDAPITITLKNITWTPAGSEVSVIVGGSDQDGTAGADTYNLIPAATGPSGNMPYYTVTTSGPDTIISLIKSPLRSQTVGTQGLAPDWRLYGMEYIPAPMEDFVNANPFPFTIDLTNATAGRPKNTARWILTIPDAVLPDDSMITIETRIGTDPDDGTPFPPNNPANLSRTYTWRGSDLWAFGDGTMAATPNLPLTERYQIIGDPRHLPYEDLKRVHTINPGPAVDYPLGTGFNRYFDDFHNSAGNRGDANTQNEWIGWENKTVPLIVMGIKNEGGAISPDNDGWDVTEPGDPGPQGMLEIDVNRIFQIFRTVLLRTHSAYTTLSGFSYAYLGLGGEIGYDAANGFPSGIPLSSKPFTGSAGTHDENSIFSPPNDPANTTFHLKYIKRNDNQWFGRYWIGDLYPDNVYATQWNVNGNLTAGTAPTSTTFRRVPRATIPDTAAPAATDLLPTATTLTPAGRSPEEEGATAFFNIGDSDSAFHHQWSTGNGLTDMSDPNADGDTSDGTTGGLQVDGTEIANSYNLPVPNTTRISRPFRLDTNFEGRSPDHFGTPTYNTGYTSALEPASGTTPTGTLSGTFYDHEYGAPYLGSALITLKETVSGTDRGASYISMNGIDKTGESGTVFIGKWSMLTLVHSFLTGGLGTSAARIRELPRIFISPFADAALTSLTDLNVEWIMTWKRWDGDKYTDTYLDTFVEDQDTSHVLMFSTNNGASWKYAADNATTAIPGVRPTNTAMWTMSPVAPTAGPTFNQSWSGSGGFTEGSYLLRMEAYRDNIPLHYSYHQRRIFLKR